MVDGLIYWHWLILAVLLVGAEILAPGIFLIWLGVGAGLTGILAFLLPDLAWQAQGLIFAVLGLVATLTGRRLYGPTADEVSDHPDLNRRGDQHLGRTYRLSAPIVNGSGRMKVGDTTWKVAGPDLPEGASVKVVGVDGIVLLVEAVK
ncbi:MAG: NfeD family protein [Alphaproteobacteria bacterium]|nr:NfeD family protein [Alphaproteobacteria bacterium]MBF0394248.1 NfeD family protein [Alphaproteobacteria bacterium]